MRRLVYCCTFGLLQALIALVMLVFIAPIIALDHWLRRQPHVFQRMKREWLEFYVQPIIDDWQAMR